MTPANVFVFLIQKLHANMCTFNDETNIVTSKNVFHLFFIPFHLIPSLSTFCLPFIPLYNLWLSIIYFVYPISVFWKAWHYYRYCCSCCCSCREKKSCAKFSQKALVILLQILTIHRHQSYQ